MDIFSDIWGRGLEQLFGRSDGPLVFRLYIMPIVAFLVGVRLGVQDANENWPTFLSRLLVGLSKQRFALRPGWHAVGRIIVVALVLDTIYQLIVFRAFYIFQAVIVAMVCALLPYMIGRGVSQRLVSYFLKRKSEPQ